MNKYVICIVLFLSLITILTLVNLVSVIKLRRQTDYILREVFSYSMGHQVLNSDSSSLDNSFNGQAQIITVDALGNKKINGRDFVKTETASASTTENFSPVTYEEVKSEELNEVENEEPVKEETVENNEVENISLPLPAAGVNNNLSFYYNLASDSFFNSYQIDWEKTNMHYDEEVTALTFKPLYEFKKVETCSSPFCGLDEDKNNSCLNGYCLSVVGNTIYYKNNKINNPSDLKEKDILKVGVNLLQTKWIISFIFSEDGQERVYLYFFTDGEFIPLINQNIPLEIKTTYGRGNGNVSVDGDDDHFLILYSGYEGIAFLYNKGIWQDLSDYFNLRFIDGGFKAKVIKSGEKENTTWYVCSDEGSRAKLMKLWQNNTLQIQGALDLSSVIGRDEIRCSLEEEKQLKIAKTGELFSFEDRGFDNSHDYFYQSVDLNDLKGKRMYEASLDYQVINTQQDLYHLETSSDKINWYNGLSGVVVFPEKGSGIYFRVNFKSRDNNYSPWFSNLGIISYKGID